MVFQVSIGFSDLVNPEAKDDESKKYALFIGDTIQVNKDEAATVFTVPKKKIENIGIFIKGDADKDKDGSDADEPSSSAVEILNKATRGAVLQNKTRV